jgi:hypothetical protein
VACAIDVPDMKSKLRPLASGVHGGRTSHAGAMMSGFRMSPTAASAGAARREARDARRLGVGDLVAGRHEAVGFVVPVT